MKKIYLSTLIIISTLLAQAQTWNWAVDVGRWFGTETALVRTNDAGDIFTAGTFTGNATVGDTSWYQDTTDANNRAIYIARLTSDNQTVWAELIDGNNTVLWDMVVDSNNTTYVLGYYAVNLIFSDTTIGDTGSIAGAYIAAFDSTGNRLWLELIDSVSSFGNFLALDNNGDLIYATYSWGIGTFTIRKISHINGNIMWEQDYPLTYSSGEFLRLYGMVVNSNNEIYVTGGVEADTLHLNNVTYSQDTMFKYISFIAKINDASGALQNVEIVNGAIIDEMDIDAADNIYLLGHFGKAIQVRQINLPVDTCMENNCEQNFLAKLNTANTASWVRPFSDDQVYSEHIDVSDTGHVYLAVSVYTDSLAFDNVILVEDTNRSFTAVVKFDTNGMALWGVKDAGGYQAGTAPLDIAFSESGSIAITGHFHHFFAQSWFGNDTLPFTGIHSHLFLASLSDNDISTAIENAGLSPDNLYTIYPNPGNGIFTLLFRSLPSNTKIRVYDLRGSVMLNSISIKEQMHVINLESLSKGIYFVEVTIRDKTTMKKIAIQ
jgi:hypothetical protein